MRWMLILPAFLIFGCADTTASVASRAAKQVSDEQKLATLLKGLTPGETSDCISLSRARQTDRVGNTILYRENQKLVYRTDTDGGCFGLDRGDVIVTHTYSDNLCRGDIASTVDPVSHFHSGSCAIGSFTAYRAK